MPASVDADLFNGLQDAINFVAERGGGVVRTDLVDTLFAKSMKVPPGVKLEWPVPQPQTATTSSKPMSL